MSLASLTFATAVSFVVYISRERRTLQFGFEYVTDNGNDSLRRLDFTDMAYITKTFKDDFEKPLKEQEATGEMEPLERPLEE